MDSNILEIITAIRCGQNAILINPDYVIIPTRTFDAVRYAEHPFAPVVYDEISEMKDQDIIKIITELKLTPPQGKEG